VQRHHGGKKKCCPHKTSRDATRLFHCEIEGKTEDHHHQQAEEEHGVEDVFGPPLEAQVFAQVHRSQPCDGKAHACTCCGVDLLTSSPLDMTRNSSAISERMPA